MELEKTLIMFQLELCCISHRRIPYDDEGVQDENSSQYIVRHDDSVAIGALREYLEGPILDEIDTAVKEKGHIKIIHCHADKFQTRINVLVYYDKALRYSLSVTETDIRQGPVQLKNPLPELDQIWYL